MKWLALFLPFATPWLLTIWLLIIRGRRQRSQEINRCSHWPRDEVKIMDGTVVAIICRKCDKQVTNADWILRGHE